MPGDEFDPRVFEHNDERFIADPYPFYAYMRRCSPRYRAAHLFGGAWLVFCHDDARQLLCDPRLSTSRARLPVAGLRAEQRAEFEDMFRAFDGWIAFNEDHRHLCMRQHALKAAVQLRPENLLPRVRRLIDTLMRQRAEPGRFDVMQDLATPLPGLALAELLGVPAADAPRLKSWSQDISRLYGSTNLAPQDIRPIRDSALALLGYLDEIARSDNHEGSLLHELMGMEVKGYRPGRSEAVAQVVMLLFAALEPTAYLVGNAIAALQAHPDQLALVQQEPELLDALVEETLRYDTPVQFVGRLVREAFTWKDCRMETGQVVLSYVASAHRDAGHYHQPDSFRLKRSDSQHLAFGQGAHYCLGAPAVRVIAAETLGAVLRHYPTLAPAPGAATRFNSNLGFRGRTSLVLC
ncbi:cytochrome P450 [Pseudomonas chlororaphis]|uniref:Cytochrome P450 n=1 Tax=Pseudomonas chlororaphis TaxID=587753 RepID=A0A1Q8EP06_9PSED|nr:cytochrome P450 [Pseudomonas chlororaphis]OLF53516.1 hypothetical protein BTN82_17330 [Pseudomonas chlororaphis]